MNWRNTSKDNLHSGEVGSQDHYYDHPNSDLYPGDGPYGSSFTEWYSNFRQLPATSGKKNFRHRLFCSFLTRFSALCHPARAV